MLSPAVSRWAPRVGSRLLIEAVSRTMALLGLWYACLVAPVQSHDVGSDAGGKRRYDSPVSVDSRGFVFSADAQAVHP